MFYRENKKQDFSPRLPKEDECKSIQKTAKQKTSDGIPSWSHTKRANQMMISSRSGMPCGGICCRLAVDRLDDSIWMSGTSLNLQTRQSCEPLQPTMSAEVISDNI